MNISKLLFYKYLITSLFILYLYNMIHNINVLIMCGGKCGSSTLYSSLKNSDFKCLKIHSKDDYILQFKSDSLYDTINLSSKNKKIFIIDSYRTPIERKISSFFQNIHIHVPNYKTLTIQKLIHIFNLKFLNKIEEYHSINSVLTHYNIPLFKKFDFKNKYIICEKNNKVFIKILYKDIHDWNNILSKILNKKINIVNDNLSKNKDYSDIYNRFKKKYIVPKSYLQYLKKNDNEFKIYNTKEEQVAYIQKWLQRSY